MQQRKGNKEHIERIKSVKPAIVSKQITSKDLHSIYPELYASSKIDDWFNRKPIKWRVVPWLDRLHCYSEPHIELHIKCGKLYFCKSFYMKDHKTKADLISEVKQDIAFAQRVFNEYSAGLSSLVEAKSLLSDYKYPRKDIKEEKDTEISISAAVFAFVAFISVIGILIAVGASQ